MFLLGCVAVGSTWTEVESPPLGGDQQLALERLNRVRADPAAWTSDFEALFSAEESRSPDRCNDTLRGTVGPLRKVEPRAPLAPVSGLVEVAEDHAAAMASGGWFAHVDSSGIGPNERVRRAGIELDARVPSGGREYLYGTGLQDNQVESLYSRSSYSTGEAPALELGEWSTGVDSLVVDRCVPGRGHREHVLGRTVLAAEDREVGIGTAAAYGAHPSSAGFSGWTLRLVVLTRARTEGDFFLVGAVFSDADGDGAYSAGEGLGGEIVEVPALGIRTQTAAGGGFVLPVADGVSGEVVVGARSVRFEVKGANVGVPVAL